MSVNPRVDSIKFIGAVADRRAYSASVTYDGEPPTLVTFTGPTGDYGPVVMSFGGIQEFVFEPSRLGPFGEGWISRFYA